MVVRRCTQCGTASDDQYGFCIKCGHEFPKNEIGKNSCPLCGFQNPEEADYCVKCGTPLLFKSQFEKSNTALRPITVEKEYSNTPKTSRWLIVFGYIFSILGGLLGLIIAIYLSTRKDPVAKRHGHIQLAIFGMYVLIIVVLFITGNIPADAVSNYRQLLSGNFTFI